MADVINLSDALPIVYIKTVDLTYDQQRSTYGCKTHRHWQAVP